MSNHEELISHFKDVTGVDAGRAEFFLESHDWQLEVALASFYEGDGVEQIDDDVPEEIELDDNPSEEASRDSSNSKSKMKPFPKSKPKFGTLRDLENQEESSSEEEEGQAFYAGGSTTSGQQILGPGKKDIVGDMFKSCQKQSVPPPEHSRSSNQNRPNTFSGTGYKLGQTNNDSEVITPSQSVRRQSGGLIVLKLWQNGFTVNDRELKLYSDPENREFLDSIKRGEIPEEIRQEFGGVELHLDMEDHRHEEYVAPKHKTKSFTGKGQLLGSPSPAASGMTIPSDPADQAANETQAREQLHMDSTQPMTTIQIRLADGSNIRVQFNLTHTIEDVRRFITTSRPQYSLREFTLQTTYPTKELADGAKTIEQENLQNAAIMQRLK